MRKIYILCLILAMSAVPTFASVNSEIADAKDEINQTISQEADNIVTDSYPAGSIYITAEDIDAAEVKERLGGKWREISETFLWAKGDNNELNERGGETKYDFETPTEDNSFIVDNESNYVSDNIADAMILLGADIVEENAYTLSTGEIEIMPPYTTVRMFQSLGKEAAVPTLTWSLKSGDGYVSESTLYFKDTVTIKIDTDSNGEIVAEGMDLDINDDEITLTMGEEPSYTVLVSVIGTNDYISKTIEIPVVRSES